MCEMICAKRKQWLCVVSFFHQNVSLIRNKNRFEIRTKQSEIFASFHLQSNQCIYFTAHLNIRQKERISNGNTLNYWFWSGASIFSPIVGSFVELLLKWWWSGEVCESDFLSKVSVANAVLSLLSKHYGNSSNQKRDESVIDGITWSYTESDEIHWRAI